MKHFYGHSIPSTESRRAVVNFLKKRTKPTQEKCGKVN